MFIDIEVAHGRLIKDVYTFYVRSNLNKLLITFVGYNRWTRPSTRHRKWQLEGKWNPSDRRSSTQGRPDVPDSVREELDQEINARTVYDFNRD